MCDYSLAGVPNRLAVEGEQLVVHPFPTGSVGLASPCSQLLSKGTLAVCIPPGARLRLRDIPEALQLGLGLNATEEVTFVQLSAEAYEYRDAVRFQNGREILLQRLGPGQRPASTGKYSCRPKRGGTFWCSGGAPEEGHVT